jgi:voltage-gated potassium channel
MIDLIKKISVAFHRLIPGYYNALLITLAILFVFRPSTPIPFWIGLWKVWLVFTLLMALFNINFKPYIHAIAALLAIPAFGFTWVSVFYMNEAIVLCIAVSTILFMLICTIGILYDVILGAQVTLETLRGVVCVYVLFGFIFAYLYLLVEAYFPNSISIRGAQVFVFPNVDYFLSQMLYYSFITLLTVGYGDIVPLSGLAQTFCVIEGIIGQFYIAILVARIVAVYSLYSNKKQFASFVKTLSTIPKNKKPED